MKVRIKKVMYKPDSTFNNIVRNKYFPLMKELSTHVFMVKLYTSSPFGRGMSHMEIWLALWASFKSHTQKADQSGQQ